MTNGYFNHTNPLTRQTLARAEAVNGIFESVASGFDKLPTEDEIKQGRINYVEDTGAANAYVVDPTYPISSYTAGLLVLFKPAHANTGASTINVSGLGVVAIKRFDGTDLQANDIPSGAVVAIRHNGTHFRMEGAPMGMVTSSAASAAAAAASAAAAAQSEQNAQTYYNDFRGVYYGGLSSDPMEDPFGNPITDGDWYWNTSTHRARIYNGTMWEDIGTASLNQYLFVAVGGETEISGADSNGNVLSYNPGFVQLFKNGIRIIGGGEDYTATNGNSITFTVPLTADDEILVDAFSPFSVANALDKTQNLADLPDKQEARDNLGVLGKADNLSDVADAETARENLGLGTAATKNTGSSAGNIPEIQAGGKMPAVSAEDMTMTGRLIGIQDFIASGTYTKNPDASYVVVHVLGGGGGASGGTGAGSIYGTGISGASGGYALKRISNSLIGATETVTIGNGGAQSTAGGAGNNGGTSSFGSHCSATGGGQQNGGQGVGGDINLKGQGGFLNTMYGGTNACAAPGAPAPGPIGGPGGIALTVVGTGNAAPANSGGGGGAGLTPYNSAGSTCAGGAGGSGRVVVFEYR